MSVNGDKALPDVEAKVGGTVKKLKFTLGSLCRLDQVTGKNALDGETWKEPTTSDLRALLWAALLHENKNLTLEEVGDMISMEEIPEITQAILKAFQRSSPSEDSKKKSDEPTSQQLPTG